MNKWYFGNCIKLIGKKKRPEIKRKHIYCWKGVKKKRKRWENRQRYKKEELENTSMCMIVVISYDFKFVEILGI
jgi:hypothetical protein